MLTQNSNDQLQN